MQGISIAAFAPRIVAGTAYYPRGQMVDDNLLRRARSYKQAISAWLGFREGTLTLMGNKEYIESWIASGLGRHIEVYAHNLGRRFGAFVNQYDANVGSLTASGGPLMEVINRCSARYNPIDPTSSPPANGPETSTTIAEDTDSQGRYGILEHVRNAGSNPQADAERIRDSILEDKAQPERTEEIQPRGGQVGQITLGLLGYRAFLDHFIFDDATTLTVTAKTKIESALAADPNGLFSPDYSLIDDSGILVSAEEDDSRMALSVIKAIVAQGGASSERWLFGIYNDRQARYNAIPTRARYQHRIVGRAQRIETFGAESPVAPYDVVAGEWVFLPDYLPGRTRPTTDLRKDPRYLFAENVAYDWPYTVTIQGRRQGKLDQIMATYGVGGAA